MISVFVFRGHLSYIFRKCATNINTSSISVLGIDVFPFVRPVPFRSHNLKRPFLLFTSKKKNLENLNRNLWTPSFFYYTCRSCSSCSPERYRSLLPTRHGNHHHQNISEYRGEIQNSEAENELKLEGQEHSKQSHQESKVAFRITMVGLVVNLGIGSLKLISGLVSNSAVMVADAAHSLTDVISDVVTMFCVRLARMTPTENFPYGYGKIESIGALVVSSILVTTGIGIFSHSIEHLQNVEAPSEIALWAGLLSIALKEGLYQVTNYIGRKQRSQLLIANAWHHRIDALSTLFALLGIFGAQMGFPLADPLAGIVVSTLIFKAGLSSGWETVKELLDVRVEKDTWFRASSIASGVPGVLSCQQLRTRKMGPYVIVDVDVEVDSALNILEGQKVAREVRVQVMKQLPRVGEVNVSLSSPNEKLTQRE